MRFIRDLNPESIKLLQRISRESKFFQVRDRAKCLILSYQGFSMKELMAIFGISRKTLHNWLTRWEDQKMAGLYDQKGRGRKPKLTKEQEQEVKTWVKSDPKFLKKTKAKIHRKWGVEVSKETLKRIIKKLGMKWKRMKRGMSKSPDEWDLEVKIPIILDFKKKEQQEEIDIWYFDESGFSLKPSIPYGWQENKERITLRSSQSKRLNVLGLMNRKNELFYEIRTGKVDSDIVLNFFDKFVQQISKPTVIFMDQAPIHTSDRIIEKLPEWELKKLKIFWLPTYSPKQNLIEILWKFIKYEWIEVEAYESWSNLFKYLKKILDNFGKEYVINFG